jgi:hypothetical protein
MAEDFFIKGVVLTRMRILTHREGWAKKAQNEMSSIGGHEFILDFSYSSTKLDRYEGENGKSDCSLFSGSAQSWSRIEHKTSGS